VTLTDAAPGTRGAGETIVHIHLTARHCDLDPSLREFAQQRLEKLTKYDGKIHEVRVIVSQERKLHTAEITLRAHHQDVIITESHADARAAIELAADRLEERVRRGKEKRISSPRRNGRANGAIPPGTGVEGTDEPTEESDEL
jgi:putative sigma-54 modulation protein